MEKKITSQGPKGRESYTVTLPKEWVRQQKVDRSRLVELETVGSKVIISAAKEMQERVVVKADDYDDCLIKVIPALYRLGINEVALKVSNPKLLDEIFNIVSQRLIGYEVIEQKKDSVVIRDITRESEEDFRTILRRIFLLSLELVNTDKAQLKAFDRNIKRLINYCQRILVKKGHADFLHTPLYYLLLDQIEKINDEFRWALKSPLSKDRLAQLKEIEKIYRVSYELFYKFDSGMYNKFQEKAYVLKNVIRVGKTIDQAGMHLHNLSRQLNSFYGTIFALRFS